MKFSEQVFIYIRYLINQLPNNQFSTSLLKNSLLHAVDILHKLIQSAENEITQLRIENQSLKSKSIVVLDAFSSSKQIRDAMTFYCKVE